MVEQTTIRKRAFAFSGGGFDTVVQLGVAHALLVSRGAAPDYVVGISAGAINAAALAEILQAGCTHGGLNETERLSFQVDRLRNFINTQTDLPELLRGALPESLEIVVKDPLTPLELPIHFRGERDDRDKANASRAGLISLIDRFFHLQLTVGTATVIIRHLLGLKEAPEQPGAWRKVKGYVANAWGLLIVLLTRFPEVVPAIGTMTWAAVAGPNHDLFRRIRNVLTGKRTAGRIITRSRWWPLLKRAIGFVISSVTAFAVLLSGLCSVVLPRRWRDAFLQRAFDRMLEYYDLATGLLNTDIFKQQLIRCFDDQYYGPPDLTKVLDHALAHRRCPIEEVDFNRKRLSAYSDASPSIRVIPIAADVATGHLEGLAPCVPVVDALLASIAVVPLFPAVNIDVEYERQRAAQLKSDSEAKRKSSMPIDDARKGKWYIDGLNVANEPIGPLIDEMRAHAADLPESGILDIYPVSSLPVTKGELGSDGTSEYRAVLDVVRRSLQLKKLSDASLERRLTLLYKKALPERTLRAEVNGNIYIAAEVFPLELEKPRDVNWEVLVGVRESLRETVLRTVADGCRASLEGMIPKAIREKADDGKVQCRAALQERLGRNPSLPGSASGGDAGPGLSEVCAHCGLNDAQPRHLTVRDRDRWPEWPVEGERAQPVAWTTIEGTAPPSVELSNWPSKRVTVAGEDEAAHSRPLVNLLFGGGVFRGVFQMGVMNALNELRIKPDIVAGSSVGSIIAAMSARLFSEDSDDARHLRIALLSATFLTIDQLVLTDRIADFVRRLTLHGAQTRFSPRDLDLLLRRYDRDSDAGFNARMRRVAAGIERLTYMNPFELFDVIQHIRRGKFKEFLDTMHDAVQWFLDRSGIGMEILGTEPLSLLIGAHVLSTPTEPFDTFLDKGMLFLATTTNLRLGKLEILNSREPRSIRNPSLRYGLLASSAFPAVFKPREAWEISREATEMDQYTDGGLIDNLPLDAVAAFLNRASLSHVIARRPAAAPHLLFTASLEVDMTTLMHEQADVEHVVRNWKRLMDRARTFRFNKKIDAYAKVQRDLRALVNATPGKLRREPLDLEVVAVKPQWLCSTFGFHPMLGFRRRRQAASIAHGCASTLATFAEIQRDPNRQAWNAAWHVAIHDIDRTAIKLFRRDEKRPGKSDTRTRIALDPKPKAGGVCHFRKTQRCPFSAESLNALQPKSEGQLTLNMIAELMKIYELCGQSKTHGPAGAKQALVPLHDETAL